MAMAIIFSLTGFLILPDFRKLTYVFEIPLILANYITRPGVCLGGQVKGIFSRGTGLTVAIWVKRVNEVDW
jgi:hypothetical protein